MPDIPSASEGSSIVPQQRAFVKKEGVTGGRRKVKVESSRSNPSLTPLKESLPMDSPPPLKGKVARLKEGAKKLLFSSKFRPVEERIAPDARSTEPIPVHVGRTVAPHAEPEAPVDNSALRKSLVSLDALGATSGAAHLTNHAKFRRIYQECRGLNKDALRTKVETAVKAANFQPNTKQLQDREECDELIVDELMTLLTQETLTSPAPEEQPKRKEGKKSGSNISFSEEKPTDASLISGALASLYREEGLTKAEKEEIQQAFEKVIHSNYANWDQAIAEMEKQLEQLLPNNEKARDYLLLRMPLFLAHHEAESDPEFAQKLEKIEGDIAELVPSGKLRPALYHALLTSSTFEAVQDLKSDLPIFFPRASEVSIEQLSPRITEVFNELRTAYQRHQHKGRQP